MPVEVKSSGSLSCVLGYPDRFEAAVKFIRMNAGKILSQETQLLLYALEQQATKGDCKSPKPGGWGWGSAEDIAKWQSWSHLKDMNKMEAMRLYVRTVEEEQADWYSLLLLVAEMQESDQASKDAMGLAASTAVLGSWTPVPCTGAGRQPLPRYEHAAGIIGDSLFVVGGNYSGRYLNDVWILEPAKMVWSTIPTRPFKLRSHGGCYEGQCASITPATSTHSNGLENTTDDASTTVMSPLLQQEPGLPPIAGHTATTWQHTLVILGGHTKAKDAPASLPVYVMDPIGDVAVLEPTGTTLPRPRGGHTASLIGKRLYVFGGEDPHRRPLSDLWSLDLESITWTKPETTGPVPSARSAHAATSYLNRYLLLFGGGTVANCFNDLFMLDTHAIPMQWTQLSGGKKVTPRAGHSGIVIGSTWYIVGGGNNVKGCTDMLALDLTHIQSGRVSWHVVASIPIRDPLSSEGVSLALLPSIPSPGADSSAITESSTPKPDEKQHEVLISFGGYNGKYHNAVSVIKVPTVIHSEERTEIASGRSRTEDESQKPTSKPTVPSTSSSKTETTADKATAAAAAAATKPGSLPLAASSATSVAPGAITAPSPPPPSTHAEVISDLKVQLVAARRDAEAALREAAGAKEAAGHELVLLRKELNKAHVSLAEAIKGLEESKQSLSKERQKVMKLEAEIAELNKKLGAAAELQKEVESLRRMVKEAEAKKATSGVWGYLSGQ
ncbi:hypothetical protein CEUSTIGMA_g5694.t1 [Chlamydomonas eustigma]|uniref:ACB domain-containing protein n=1 Tax=Chlamydomonas eustigma TaxID=1157962 RepID=A0A250X5T3_9CHLO|nr:hypothetical protein CEUSTIGMA_g5694.t1 [Chlamydomonas eustigma]|eukprot:GAX78252.1 hypothetical protein CEUSTIGMA_g5694.t1 [Chlamydomonas eustigma]